MDRGDWAGVQDMLPVPSVKYGARSVWFDMTQESPVVCAMEVSDPSLALLQ